MKVKGLSRTAAWAVLLVVLVAALPPLLPETGVAGAEPWEVYSFDEPVLRLHILAHSDAPEDQRIKEQVAVEARRFLQSRIPGDGPESRNFLKGLLPELEQALSLQLQRLGCSAEVTAVLVQEDFPLRAYGRHIYPQGLYPALKIILGRGEGENWWCLLFPPLCLPVVEAKSSGEPGEEIPAEPVLLAYPASSETPAGPARWVLKIREQLERWAARVAAQ